MKHLKLICAAAVLVLALTLIAHADCGQMQTPCAPPAPNSTNGMGAPGASAPTTVDTAPGANPVGEITFDFLLTMLALF